MNWWRNLFKSNYARLLESQLEQQRQDFTERLNEKNQQIRMLRTELAAEKASQQPPQAMFGKVTQVDETRKPVKFELPTDWQADLTTMLQEEEDGIRNGGRIQEHEPRTNDGA